MRIHLLLFLSLFALIACTSSQERNSTQDVVDYEVIDDTDAIEEIVEDDEDFSEADIVEEDTIEEIEDPIEPDPDNYVADAVLEEEFDSDILEAEQVWQPEKKVVTQRTTTIVKEASLVTSSFKNGYYNVAKDCNMRLKPSSKGYKAGVIKKGKTVWAEDHTSGWAKVYRKGGAAAYVYKGCL